MVWLYLLFAFAGTGLLWFTRLLDFVWVLRFDFCLLC